METHDVVICGGRLAGSAAAAALARAGKDVVVLERGRLPSDTLSTHVLFSAGIEEVRRMGALDDLLALDPSKLRGIQLHMGDDVVVREPWSAEGETDYVLCVPRTLQDVVLSDAARRSGADVREGCEVQDVLWEGGRAVGVRYRDADGEVRDVRCRLVLGADGRRSTVAARVGAWRPYRGSLNGRGLVFRYLDDPQAGTALNETLMQWRDGTSFCMVFPSAPRPRTVALVMGPAADVPRARKDPEGTWAEFLRRHPGFAERIAGATNLGKLRSTNDVSAYFRPSSGPGWALIGDAGHFKDPVIGQGQRDALWMGRTAGEAAAAAIEDPAALDAALRRWEQRRDDECLPAYHLANAETRIAPQPAALVEIARRAQRRHDPDLSDLFQRTRTQQQVLSVPRLLGGAAGAMARRPRQAGRILRDSLPELRTDLAVRAEARAHRFRSTRVVPGSEHPGWTWPAAPARRGGARSGASPGTSSPSRPSSRSTGVTAPAAAGTGTRAMAPPIGTPVASGRAATPSATTTEVPA